MDEQLPASIALRLMKMSVCNAKIAQLQVDVESMKAANTERQQKGFSIAYGEEAFGDISNAISAVVREMEEI